MFITILFIIARNWEKKNLCPTIWGILMTQYNHRREYCAAVKMHHV